MKQSFLGLICGFLIVFFTMFNVEADFEIFNENIETNSEINEELRDIRENIYSIGLTLVKLNENSVSLPCSKLQRFKKQILSIRRKLNLLDDDVNEVVIVYDVLSQYEDSNVYDDRWMSRRAKKHKKRLMDDYSMLKRVAKSQKTFIGKIIAQQCKKE